MPTAEGEPQHDTGDQGGANDATDNPPGGCANIRTVM